MRPRASLFAIFAAFLVAIVFAAPADAGPRSISQGGGLKRLLGDIVIPAAWSGIWSNVDSTFDCLGNFESTASRLDTLCTAQSADPDEGGPFPVECTGTVTDNTFDLTCFYSEPVDTNCVLSFTVVMHGTISANSYVMTNTTTLETTGTGKICEFFPAECTRVVSRGTRLAPEPVAYCSTPVDATTWGRIKSRYR